MKKNKLLILTALAALTCAGCTLAACGGGGGDDSSSVEPIREKVVSIADFETWETGFQLIRTGQFFGQIRVNENADYVKTGSRSAQIRPMGSYRKGTAPIMFFPTKSDLFDFDHSDFSDAEKVTFEFYYNKRENDPETLRVATGLVTSVTQILVFNTTSIEYQELQAGWNTVTYSVDVSALSINADVKNIQGIYVAFENAGVREEADAPDVYLDDVTLYRYDEPQEVHDLIQLAENEYADFEHDWQKNVISPRSTACAPELSLVTASDYKIGAAPAEGEEDTRETLTAKSGERVLRLWLPSSTAKETFYPGVDFASALLRKSKFGSLTPADYGTVTFAFDVFNNSAVSQHMGIDFYNARNNRRKEYGFDVPAYEWLHWEINLKTLYEDFAAANAGQTDLFTNPGTVSFVWPEFTGDDREIFIDNMHFIVEEKDPTATPQVVATSFVRKAQVGSSIDLPVISTYDRYDLSLKYETAVYYNNVTAGGEDNWETVKVKNNKVSIDKAGTYKLVVTTAKNSVGNSGTQEYLFVGVDKLEGNIWADYTFADEADTVHIDGAKSDTNKVEWLQEVTLDGETHEGVIKATTSNATKHGSGYIGFGFAEKLVEKASDIGWDYFVVRMYIDAPVGAINLYSWNRKLHDVVRTGEWIDLIITKEMLNAGNSYVNRAEQPLQDIVFYSVFEKFVCSETLQALFYTTSLKQTAANSTITYYIDNVTWVKSEHGSYNDGDDGVADNYADEVADPFTKKEN